MYFPYLRGRQFELIALRELVEKNLISDNLIPIIEPIKATSTLRTTLKLFIENKKSIAVVHNPQVGSFIDEFNKLEDKNELKEIINSTEILKTHIMNEKTENEIQCLCENGTNLKDIAVINTKPEFLTSYLSLFKEEDPKYVFISDHARFRRSITKNKALFENRFKSEERNADYENRDIFFSDDHLFFSDEQFKGFSDYSIVGDYFSESGFAPYAVAIHIVYFDSEKNLRVKSYVSDSNDDIRDPANKYYEALTHLVTCPIINGVETHGLNEFRKHYSEGTYPGLGTVKKLAIMHHLELMSEFLESEKST